MRDNPIIRLQVEAMGEQFAAMIMVHSEEVSDAMTRGIKKAAENIDFAEVARAEAEKQMKAAVETAVQRYFGYGGAGKEAIDALVDNMMRPGTKD